jgi:hypothetical protein
MADETSNLGSRIAGDPQSTARLVGALTAKNAGALKSLLDDQLSGANESMQSWAQQFTQNITLAQTAMTGFQGSTEKAFNSLSQGMTKHIRNTSVYAQSVGDAMEKALKSTLTAITSEAVVRAIYNTGLGFYFLAVQAYDQATQAFEAAAVFGSVAGVAGAVGEAVSGSAGGSAGASVTTRTSSSTRSKTTTSQTSTAGTSTTPSGNLTVMVVGESQAASWLTRVINTGVEQHDLRLVASHTKRSAPAGR